MIGNIRYRIEDLKKKKKKPELLAMIKPSHDPIAPSKSISYI